MKINKLHLSATGKNRKFSGNTHARHCEEQSKALSASCDVATFSLRQLKRNK